MMESCDTLTHEQVKSDHIAVLLNIDVCDEPNTEPPKPTWQTKKVNWEHWKDTLEKKCEDWINNNTSINDIDELSASFQEMINCTMTKLYHRR